MSRLLASVVFVCSIVAGVFARPAVDDATPPDRQSLPCTTEHTQTLTGSRCAESVRSPGVSSDAPSTSIAPGTGLSWHSLFVHIR